MQPSFSPHFRNPAYAHSRNKRRLNNGMLKPLNKRHSRAPGIGYNGWPCRMADGIAKIFHRRSKQPQRNRGMFGRTNTFTTCGEGDTSRRKDDGGGWVGNGGGVREHIACRLLCTTSRRAGGVNGGGRVYGEL